MVQQANANDPSVAHPFDAQVAALISNIFGRALDTSAVAKAFEYNGITDWMSFRMLDQDDSETWQYTDGQTLRHLFQVDKKRVKYAVLYHHWLLVNEPANDKPNQPSLWNYEIWMKWWKENPAVPQVNINEPANDEPNQQSLLNQEMENNRERRKRKNCTSRECYGEDEIYKRQRINTKETIAATMSNNINQRLDNLQTEFNQRLDSNNINQRLDNSNQRLDSLQTQFNQRLDSLQTQFDYLQTQLRVITDFIRDNSNHTQPPATQTSTNSNTTQLGSPTNHKDQLEPKQPNQLLQEQRDRRNHNDKVRYHTDQAVRQKKLEHANLTYNKNRAQKKQCQEQHQQFLDSRRENITIEKKQVDFVPVEGSNNDATTQSGILKSLEGTDDDNLNTRDLTTLVGDNKITSIQHKTMVPEIANSTTQEQKEKKKINDGERLKRKKRVLTQEQKDRERLKRKKRVLTQEQKERKKIYDRNRLKNNPELVRERRRIAQRKWFKNNPELVRERRRIAQRKCSEKRKKKQQEKNLIASLILSPNNSSEDSSEDNVADKKDADDDKNEALGYFTRKRLKQLKTQDE